MGEGGEDGVNGLHAVVRGFKQEIGFDLASGSRPQPIRLHNVEVLTVPNVRSEACPNP
jgi:hypothetical protein